MMAQLFPAYSSLNCRYRRVGEKFASSSITSHSDIRVMCRIEDATFCEAAREMSPFVKRGSWEVPNLTER